MAKSKQELKTQLMKEAEAVIDELLDWHLKTSEPNLGQVEEKVLGLRQRLSEQMSQAVIANQEAVRPVPGPVCEGCGQGMAYWGRRKKRLLTKAGPIEVERDYYYCGGCGRGVFPPG